MLNFDVTFVAANCGNDYPLLGIKDAVVEHGSTNGVSVTFSDSSWPQNATVTITRIEKSSPPVTGNVTISWKNKFAGNCFTCSIKIIIIMFIIIRLTWLSLHPLDYFIVDGSGYLLACTLSYSTVILFYNRGWCYYYRKENETDSREGF